MKLEEEVNETKGGGLMKLGERGFNETMGGVNETRRGVNETLCDKVCFGVYSSQPGFRYSYYDFLFNLGIAIIVNVCFKAQFPVFV